MRKIRKALGVLLAVAMMLSLAVTGFAYSDYDADTAESNDSYLAVDILTQLGYVEGYEDGTFRADGDYTREQAAKIITYVIAGTASGDNIGATTVTTSFTDANDRWSTPYIAYAEATGIIAGYGNGLYGPEDTLTEAQWIKMLLVAVCGEDPDQFLGDGWETVAIDIATETFMIDTIYDEDAFDREMVAELTVDALIHAELLTYEIVVDEDTGLPSQVVYSFTDGRTETASYDIETVALSDIASDADVAVYYNGEYVGDEIADAVTDENGLVTYAYVIDDIFGEDTYYLVYQASTQYKLTDDGVELYNIYESLGASTGVIGTVTAISGTYPDYSYVVVDGVEYTLSENYATVGTSAVLSVNDDYVFYLDLDGNIIYVAEYEAPVETVDPIETGYVYVYSAAVYSSAEGVKGESAYDYTYEYDFQISLEVLIVPEETGTASIEIVDLALVQVGDSWYAYDAYGNASIKVAGYDDLIETIINDYNAAIDSANGDDAVNVCGVEFAVTGSSVTIDVNSFYTYYEVDGDIALIDAVDGTLVGITGSTALTTVNGYDAKSSAEYTIITFNYYDDEFVDITVYVGGITEDILDTYGYGFTELTPNGYVENTVLITVNKEYSEPYEPTVEYFYGIYLGTEAETIDGMTLVFGLSDGTITEGSDAILLDDSVSINGFKEGTVYYVQVTDGVITGAAEQYIAVSGVVYALGDEYVSLYDEAQDSSRPYSSYAYGDYAGTSYLANPDFDQITELSETIIPASKGDYINVYTETDEDGNVSVVFITVGHTIGDTYETSADCDGYAADDEGNYIEKTYDGADVTFYYYNDYADINGNTHECYDIVATESPVDYYVLDGEIENGEFVGTILEVLENGHSHYLTDDEIAEAVEVTGYDYDIELEPDGDLASVDIYAYVTVNGLEYTVDAEQSSGYLIVKSGKITGITTSTGSTAALADDYYNETEGVVTTENGQVVVYVTERINGNNLVVYSVSYNPGDGMVTVLMNIPYYEFYTALDVNFGDADVDVITAATSTKGITYSLAAGSYHEYTDDGSAYITGSVYYVSVPISALEGLTEITDDSYAAIETTNRGTTSTTELYGADVLFDSPSYSYYLVGEDVDYYFIMDEELNIIAYVGEETDSGEIAYEFYTGADAYSNYQYALYVDSDALDEILDGETVSGVVLVTEEGDTYGLTHVEGIWLDYELAWAVTETTVHSNAVNYEIYAAIQGETITSVIYYTTDGVYVLTLDEPVYVPCYADTVTAEQASDSYAITVSGIPTDAEDVTITLTYTESRTEYEVDITVTANEDGTYTITPAEDLTIGTTYTVNVSSSNYALNTADVTIVEPITVVSTTVTTAYVENDDGTWSPKTTTVVTYSDGTTDTTVEDADALEEDGTYYYYNSEGTLVSYTVEDGVRSADTEVDIDAIYDESGYTGNVYVQTSYTGYVKRLSYFGSATIWLYDTEENYDAGGSTGRTLLMNLYALKSSNTNLGAVDGDYVLVLAYSNSTGTVNYYYYVIPLNGASVDSFTTTA